MKSAIIFTGGKQYPIVEDQILTVEKLEKKEGAAIAFDKVLVAELGGKTLIGQPFLKNVKVTGKVVSHGQAKKVMVVKFKSKVRYRRRKGHRQLFTKVKIEKIELAK